MTVARAAHVIHMFNPKIKIGSNIIFSTAENIITIIAILEYHTDLITLLFHILKHKNTIPISNIEKYSAHNETISGVAPKNTNNGLINNSHNIEKIIANEIFVTWNVQKVFETYLSFFSHNFLEIIDAEPMS